MSVRTWLRPFASTVITLLAALLVLLALIVPDQITRLPPDNSVFTALVRIPIEAMAAIAVLLVLPERARRWLATMLGLILGLLTVLKIMDAAFFAVLARQFDPVLDWSLLPAGYGVVQDSIGKTAAAGVAVGLIALAVAIPALMALAMRRLSRLLAAHANVTRRTVFAFSCAWLILAIGGIQFVAGVPVAATSAIDLARDTTLNLPHDLADKRTFAREVAVDAFRDVPDNQLLTGLRGKDVILSFVESYGRDAVQNPEFDGQVLQQLRADDGKLTAAGFSARSGFLTSSTSGGNSWLAHSTLLSGLQIDNQQRYRSLVTTDRLTLTKAFSRAGFRTVGVEPGVTYAPEPGPRAISTVTSRSGIRTPSAIAARLIVPGFRRSAGRRCPINSYCPSLESWNTAKPPDHPRAARCSPRSP